MMIEYLVGWKSRLS